MVFKIGHKFLPEIQKRMTENLRLHPTYGFLGKKHSMAHRKYMSEIMKGRKHDWGLKGNLNPAKREDVRKKISNANMGRKRTEEANRKTSMTMQRLISEGNYIRKKGTVPWNKGKSFPQVSGSLNVNWKGGIASINELIRKSDRYIEWSRAIKVKDNYTCQLCGQHGGQLHSDHIKPFFLFPELRFDLENGRTLCVSCHRNTDTYGRRKPEKELMEASTC